MKTFYTALNVLLSLWVLFIGAVFFSLQDLSGYLFALVALIAAGFIQTRKMWSYFVAGVLGVASYQLSKIGFEFSYERGTVMLSGMLIIPLAIFLSVKLGKTAPKA